VNSPAVRVLDALDGADTIVRMHDGINLITDDDGTLAA
jgi:hypothetical protein